MFLFFLHIELDVLKVMVRNDAPYPMVFADNEFCVGTHVGQKEFPGDTV